MNNEGNFRYISSMDAELIKSKVPCDRLFYLCDEEACKTSVFVLSEDKTKLQTFEDYKNKNDKYVDFELDPDVDYEFSKVKLADGRMAINPALRSDLRTYVVDYGDVITTVEFIDQFIEESEDELRELKGKDLNEEEILSDMRAYLTNKLLTREKTEEAEETEEL